MASGSAKPGAASERSGEGWKEGAAELYRALVRARLAETACQACGESLEAAQLVRSDTSVGPELNELALSDAGAARFLAATDDLIVECACCGARGVVPAPRPAR